MNPNPSVETSIVVRIANWNQMQSVILAVVVGVRYKTQRHLTQIIHKVISLQEAPLYQIKFRGLTAYRNVAEPTKAAIRRMIDGSKNSLFKHHPQTYGYRCCGRWCLC
jgi:hypothetical protein